MASTAIAAGLTAAAKALPAGAATGHSAKASQGAAAKQKVYVAAEGCSGHFYKPSKVILACADANLYITGLKYSAYGTSSARAAGTIHLNACTPDCAGGHFHTYPGSIRFFDVVKCSDGRRYFSRAKYRFSGPNGSGTEDVGPLRLRCKAA
ncbi:MAG TPA: hypothetical protein VGF95_06920 [Solirubrobacteraceae bacterium]